MPGRVCCCPAARVSKAAEPLGCYAFQKPFQPEIFNLKLHYTILGHFRGPQNFHDSDQRQQAF